MTGGVGGTDESQQALVFNGTLAQRRMPPRVKSTARRPERPIHDCDVELVPMILDEGVLYSGSRAKYAAAFF